MKQSTQKRRTPKRIATRQRKSVSGKCQFSLSENPCEAGYECIHNAEALSDESFCIFHLSKLTIEEKRRLVSPELKNEAEEIERKFNEELSVLIERQDKNASVDFIDLRGFRFPKIPQF